MADRTYTEQEIRALLERAAVRQEAARRAEAAAHGGLTLAELQAIAAEAGIAPEHVAGAAAEMAHAPEAPRTVLGAPVEVRKARYLPGRISDETWAAFVQEARQTFRDSGMAGQIGPVREWTSVRHPRNNGVVTRLTLEPEGEGARVTVTKDAHEMGRGFAIASGMTALMALLFTVITLATGEADTWVAVAMMAAMAVLFTAGSQVGLRLWARAQDGRFDALLDRLELLARGDAAPARAAAPERTGAPRPALELEPLDDAAASEADPVRTRTRTGRT